MWCKCKVEFKSNYKQQVYTTFFFDKDEECVFNYKEGKYFVLKLGVTPTDFFEGVPFEEEEFNLLFETEQSIRNNKLNIILE